MILVSGGAGFIGGALLWELNGRGYTDLVCIDRWGLNSKWKNIQKRQLLDLLAPEEIWNFIDRFHTQISAIVHLGACSSTTQMDVHYLLQNNLRFSQNLFLKAQEYHLPFYYASSAATYGAGESGYEDRQDLICDLKPLNPYGLSKHWFDVWVLKQHRKPPSWAGFKFFNVYGPGEYHKEHMRSVVLKTFEQLQAQKGGSLKLFRSYRSDFADGEQKRDFIYVKDVVRILADVVEQKSQENCGIYNLGSGIARTFLDLGQSVCHAMNLPFSVQWIDMPDDIKNQYQYFTQADMKFFKQSISSALPQFSLEDGIEDYIKNYLFSSDPYL